MQMIDDKSDGHKSEQIVYIGVNVNFSSKPTIIVPGLPRM